MTSIFSGAHAIDGSQQFTALLRHDDHRGRGVDDLTAARGAAPARLGQNRVQGRHDRHVELRQQRQDVTARLAAEYSELVLEADDIELSAIEESAARR